MKPLKDSELHKTVRIHMQKRLLNVPVGTSDPAYIHHVTQAIVEGVADAEHLEDPERGQQADEMAEEDDQHADYRADQNRRLFGYAITI